LKPTVKNREEPRQCHLSVHRLSDIRTASVAGRNKAERPVIELNQKVEMGPFPRPTIESEIFSALDDQPLHLQVLREVLESDSYQVALFREASWVQIRGSRADTFSGAVPAVLLPFSWKELVAPSL